MCYVIIFIYCINFLKSVETALRSLQWQTNSKHMSASNFCMKLGKSIAKTLEMLHQDFGDNSSGWTKGFWMACIFQGQSGLSSRWWWISKMINHKKKSDPPPNVVKKKNRGSSLNNPSEPSHDWNQLRKMPAPHEKLASHHVFQERILMIWDMGESMEQ